MSERYRRNATVLWRRVGPGVVLLAPGMIAPLSLGSDGSALWAALARPLDVDRAVSVVGPDPAAGDQRDLVRTLLGVLALHGAVEVLR